MPARAVGKPRVVYICGWGRSGTTLIDRMLGEVPGFASVGELRSLWDFDPAVQRCGCGRPVASCPLWGPILVSLDSIAGLTPAAVRALRDDVARSRHLVGLRMSAGRLPEHVRPAVRTYGDVLVGIYRTLGMATGSSVIVDSSKHPAEALLLAGRRDVDLTVLHVVRDPRGVAYSWNRARPDDGAADLPPRRGELSSSAWWTVWNGAVEALVRPLLRSRYEFLRYEDVMADPETLLGSVVQRLGGAAADLPLRGAHQVRLSTSHTVAGNPSRMQTGTMRVQVDREWETEMSGSSLRRATVAALPLLHHYGYDARRPPAAPQIG